MSTEYITPTGRILANYSAGKFWFHKEPENIIKDIKARKIRKVRTVYGEEFTPLEFLQKVTVAGGYWRKYDGKNISELEGLEKIRCYWTPNRLKQLCAENGIAL